jgi:hypothetical protein
LQLKDNENGAARQNTQQQILANQRVAPLTVHESAPGDQ